MHGSRLNALLWYLLVWRPVGMFAVLWSRSEVTDLSGAKHHILFLCVPSRAALWLLCPYKAGDTMATVGLNSCVKSLRTHLSLSHTHTHTLSLTGTRCARSTGHWLALSLVLFKPARLLHFQKQVGIWKHSRGFAAIIGTLVYHSGRQR